QYRLGEISKLELLGVQLELSASRLSRLDSLVKAQSAIADLEVAMQVPLDLDKLVLAAPARRAKQAQEKKNE
ncbi:MAG TPA: hypothetical protein VF451_03015, partial [Acidobacteriota bacterium]